MKLVLQGDEVTVTVKADRKLTTQEIVMAHQLSTGEFEALFVADETPDDKPSEPATQVKHAPDDIPEWVQVEVMCPQCTYEGRTTTKYGNYFTKCPSCKTPLYNSYATGFPGEKDKAGNYYHCNEILRPKNGGLTREEQELLDQMQAAK